MTIMRLVRPRFIRLVVVVVSTMVVLSLSRSIWKLWKKQDVVRERQIVLEEEQKTAERLKKELEQAQTPGFVEREAREKLGMVKEGETVVIMPNDQSFGSAQDKTDPTSLKLRGATISEQSNTNNDASGPNWKKWWRLVN